MDRRGSKLQYHGGLTTGHPRSFSQKEGCRVSRTQQLVLRARSSSYGVMALRGSLDLRWLSRVWHFKVHLHPPATFFKKDPQQRR